MGMIESLEPRQLLAFGTLDPTFGDHGHVADPGAAHRPAVDALYVQPDGKIVTAGNRVTMVNRNGLDAFEFHAVAARYNVDGTLDKSFACDGTADITAINLASKFVAILPVTGGYLLQADYSPIPFIRVRSDGTVDNHFQIDNFGLAASDAKQRLLVFGNDGFHRYLSDGSIDRTFGENGEASVLVNLPVLPNGFLEVLGVGKLAYHNNGTFTAMTIDRDGSILITGYYVLGHLRDINIPLPFFIRLNGQTGAVLKEQIIPLDASKLRRWTYSGFQDAPKQLAPSPARSDGKNTIYVSYRRRLMRLTSDLKLDTSYAGGSGVIAVKVPLRNGSTSMAAFRDWTVQSNGKVLAISRSIGGDPDPLANHPMILRLNADGTIDKALLDTPSPSLAYFNAHDKTLTGIELAPDGTLVVAGKDMPVSRLFRDEAPVGRLEAPPLTTPLTGSYVFSVLWRDDDGIDAKSLTGREIRVVGPTGTAHAVRILRVTVKNRYAIRVYYRVSPFTDGHHWTTADNGAYAVRLMPNTVRDVNGVAAERRTFGSFPVSIA